MKMVSALRRFFESIKIKILPVDKITIYTDGGHKGRWGTWAYVVVRKNLIEYEASGRVRRTNSHRMEFQAAIEALKYLSRPSHVVIKTDSRILSEVVSKKSERSASNQDQIDIIAELSQKHQVEWQWVKGHHGNQFNERCDRLCRLAREINSHSLRTL